MVTPTPLLELEEIHNALLHLDESVRQKVDILPEKTATLYAAFLSDGKEDLANRIAERGFLYENTPQMRERLVDLAWYALQPRPVQILWLWQAKIMAVPAWVVTAATIALTLVALLGLSRLARKKLNLTSPGK